MAESVKNGESRLAGTKSAKKSRPRTPAIKILRPAEGPRTVPHSRIKSAVDKVLRERLGRDA